MTAFAAIILDDGAATPVAHTFNPSAIDPTGVAKLFEAASTFDERSALSLSVRLPKVGGTVARVMTKVMIPVLDTASTPPKKIGECIFTGEFVIPKQVDADTRKNLLAYAKNYLADASVVAAVENLESIY